MKHIGLVTKNGRRDKAALYLSKINNWSQKLTDIHIDEQFDKWKEKSNY